MTMAEKTGAGGKPQNYDESTGRYGDGSGAGGRLLEEVSYYNKKTKEKQFEIIQKENPMRDDYHQGIRSPKDIKTWQEAMQDDESFEWGDFSKKDAENALKTGQIKIYSSYPIKNGVFVSTSYNQARDYAGGGKVYSEIVPLNNVAWINGDEGQFAKVNAYNEIF